MRYEKLAQEYLCATYGEYYLPGPWFRYFEEQDTRERWCQPDGILFQPLHRLLTVVEIKGTHTARAWWQTEYLYVPVLRKALREITSQHWETNICEVVRWYDKDVVFPRPYRLVRDPLLLQPREFGVHIWVPAKRESAGAGAALLDLPEFR